MLLFCFSKMVGLLLLMPVVGVTINDAGMGGFMWVCCFCFGMYGVVGLLCECCGFDVIAFCLGCLALLFGCLG